MNENELTAFIHQLETKSSKPFTFPFNEQIHDIISALEQLKPPRSETIKDLKELHLEYIKAPEELSDGEIDGCSYEKHEYLAEKEIKAGDAFVSILKSVSKTAEAIPKEHPKTLKSEPQKPSDQMIYIDLKKFNKSKSLNLLQDLIQDTQRTGVKQIPKKHGKQQPKSLNDILRKIGYEDVAKAITFSKKTITLSIPIDKIRIA